MTLDQGVYKVGDKTITSLFATNSTWNVMFPSIMMWQTNIWILSPREIIDIFIAHDSCCNSLEYCFHHNIKRKRTIWEACKTEKRYIFMIKIDQLQQSHGIKEKIHGLLKRGYDKTGCRRRYWHGQCKYENISQILKEIWIKNNLIKFWQIA